MTVDFTHAPLLVSSQEPAANMSVNGMQLKQGFSNISNTIAAKEIVKANDSF